MDDNNHRIIGNYCFLYPSSKPSKTCCIQMGFQMYRRPMPYKQMTQPNEDKKMNCPFCNKEALWCENKAIYGQNYGKSYMCYYCKDCNAYVGCHNNTRQPLGTMANAEMRDWRKKVHARIDPLWKEGSIKRKHLYARISKAIGKTYHTGETTVEDCKKILELNLESL